MVNGMFRNPNSSIQTWHSRGGLQGPSNITYIIDPATGEQTPVVYGTDQYGNPTLVTPDNAAPWYASLLQSGIQTTGNIFGAHSYASPYGGPGAVSVGATATPSGVSLGGGISQQTLILIGAAVLLFVLARKR